MRKTKRHVRVSARNVRALLEPRYAKHMRKGSTDTAARGST